MKKRLCASYRLCGIIVAVVLVVGLSCSSWLKGEWTFDSYDQAVESAVTLPRCVPSNARNIALRASLATNEAWVQFDLTDQGVTFEDLEKVELDSVQEILTMAVEDYRWSDPWLRAVHSGEPHPASVFTKRFHYETREFAYSKRVLVVVDETRNRAFCWESERQPN